MPADGLETKETQKVWWDFCTKELETDEKEPSGDSNEEWSRSLDAYGIKQDLKDAIMDPVFSYLRLSQSCRHWIKDTMDMYYKWLQRRVFEPETAMSTWLFLKPKEGTKFCDDYEFRPKHPGYIPLYMVVDEDRIHHLFDEQGNLDNLDQLRTTGASDFSGSLGCFYFIHQLKLAELHARYAKRGAGGASVAILCVFVSLQEYWRLKVSGKAVTLSGLAWLRFVWECRKGLSSSPSRLFDNYGKATLLYGDIPLHREHRRTRIKNETTSDVIRKLTWSHGGIERGRQYMFSTSAGERFLREHAKFRILAYQDL